MESSSRAYASSGSAENKKAFDDAAARAEEAREAFRREAYGTFVSYQAANGRTEVCALEHVILSRLQAMIDRLDTVPPAIMVEDRRVDSFVVNDMAGSASQVNEIVFYVRYFDRLSYLGCRNTSLSRLPDLLPESLRYIDIANTLAAKDPRVIATLDALKARRPDVVIEV